MYSQSQGWLLKISSPSCFVLMFFPSHVCLKYWQKMFHIFQNVFDIKGGLSPKIATACCPCMVFSWGYNQQPQLRQTQREQLIPRHSAQWSPNCAMMLWAVTAARTMTKILTNKMKPTNPNADTYVDKQRQYLLVMCLANSLVKHPEFIHWGDTIVWRSYLTLL